MAHSTGRIQKPLVSPGKPGPRRAHAVRRPRSIPELRALLVELVDLGLALVAILLAAAILHVWLEGSSLTQLPTAAAHNHPQPTLPLVVSISPTMPEATATSTPAPTATSTWTPTPRPTRTRLPTSTPRPTETPTPTLTPLRLSPRGLYPPTVTPNATLVISDTPVPEPAPLIEFPPDTINIVLLGSDKRPNSAGWRTDTIIVASINPNTPSVTMLSIPRDLWVYIPGWTFQRINLADVHGASTDFPGGGPGLVKQTIQYNLGVHVDYYVRVDFAGFMTIIDTLGGIDVVADCPLEDVFPDDPITEDPTITGTISIETPGVYHLDGKHALWYARSRYTSPGGDLDRNRRQHRVLRGIWNKVTELNLVARLPELWRELASTIETDLKWDDILWLASLVPRLDSSHIRSGFIEGEALQPWTTPAKASVYVPNVEKLLEQVQETFNPPGNIAPQAPVQVQVWNGTSNPDWDILATDRLQWAGYIVPSFRTADRQDYARTQIIDFTTTRKGSRLSALMTLFQVSPADVIAQPDPNSPVPYRVIVGANYNPCVRPARPRWPTPTPTPAPGP